MDHEKIEKFNWEIGGFLTIGCVTVFVAIFVWTLIKGNILSWIIVLTPIAFIVIGYFVQKIGLYIIKLFKNKI